jgi:fengycin family lipopeptide synthetase D
MTITEDAAVGDRGNDTGGADLGRRLTEALIAIGDRAAVVGLDGTGVVTGNELERRSRVAAHALLGTGAGRGSVVSIRQEDRTEIVVSVLAALRAGAAFCVVPLAYPEDRVRLIHDRIDPVRIVVASLDADADVDADADALPERTPDDLAYVIFTSGTTGTPKAVQIADRGVQYIADRAELYVGETIGQLAAMQFDASVFEILGGLLNGMTVRQLDVETLVGPDGEAVLAAVDTLFLTTQLFNLLSARSPAALAAVGLVLFGGERASARHVRDFLAARRDAERRTEHGASRTPRLLHVYGPTETTVFATSWEVEGPFDDTVPIGRALDGATSVVLDDDGAPVLDGEGELLVGGAGVMLGYRHDGAATDAAVVRIDGVPHYRTGDRVQIASDGLLTHLGRRDRQVKVSGFRVDLAEVEAAAAALDGVQQVVAVQVDGQLRLYATGTATARALRTHLRATLPRHSVPTVERVRTIPLTPNGKTDVEALVEEAFQASSDEMLRAAIVRVLQVETVPHQATFVELGGDSISAMDVVWQLDKAGIRVDVLDLLTLPVGSVRHAR